MGPALWCYRSGQPPLLRLLCFAHAGGGAFACRGWRAWLPSYVELVTVELPGRGSRLRETPATDLRAAMDALMPEILALDTTPIALFGHSMGALFAFETALRMQACDRPPRLLILAGCATPAHIAARPRIRDLPDAQFVEAFDRMGGIPDAVLDDPDLRRITLRTLRADMTMVECYRAPHAARIPCDIAALAGRRDPIASPEMMRAWCDMAAAGFTLDSFDGGHFFVQDAIGLVAGRILSLADTALVSHGRRD
ncbi:hypothetical protein A7X12_00370 [Sphingomonas sp. TDK1]|nr:hypothetical protein A7X12_00370 [Sphingomonas sp. TDK1]